MARIIIPLEQDGDGYPPFATERVWAEAVDGGIHRVDNIPFFARGISLGDLVSVEEVDGAFHFRSVIAPSTNSTVRVVFFDKSRIDAFEDGLTAIGCEGEWQTARGLLAINVHSAAQFAALLRLIERCGGEECIDREEATLRFHASELT